MDENLLTIVMCEIELAPSRSERARDSFTVAGAALMHIRSLVGNGPGAAELDALISILATEAACADEARGQLAKLADLVAANQGATSSATGSETAALH